jgi:F-type H+-transporting ATPase subunit delta
MKATATQYAKTLYEMTKDKNHSEIDDAVLNFTKFLEKNSQMKMSGAIAKKFGEIYNSQNGIVEAEVASAHKLESSQIHKVESFLKGKYRAKEVVLNNRIDESIKGGIVVRVGDEVMDGSVERKLRDLSLSLRA